MHRRFTLIALASLLVALVSCGETTHSIEVTLLDPCHLASGALCEDLEASPRDQAFCGDTFCDKNAEWAQLAAFRGGCPSEARLAEGHLTGALRVIAGKAGHLLPSLGELDDGNYGFAGLLRASDCRVVGYGCTDANLSNIRKVRVEVGPAPGKGACDVGSACHEASCIPGEDDETASCMPWLVAAGELPPSIHPNAIVSGPGIVTTDRGYLIGYREDIADTDAPPRAHVRLVPLDDEGMLGDPVDQAIEACGPAAPEIGFGMAMSGDRGLLVTPNPACNGRGAGVHLVSFSNNGAVLDSKRLDDAGPDLSLARVHSLTSARARNRFELAYVTSGTAYRLALSGTRPDDGFRSIFPDTHAGFAQLAGSGDGMAYLVDEAGEGSPVLFGFGPWESDPVVKPMAAGSSGAIATHGKRAIASVLTPQGGLRWEGLALDGSSFGSGALDVGGPFRATEVVTVGEYAILAGARASGITLASLGRVSGTLSSRAPVVAQHGPAIGGISLATYDGSSLAMASARSRFALAWLTTASGDGPVGGFAVFECTGAASDPTSARF